jgi:hypothetical protein
MKLLTILGVMLLMLSLASCIPTSSISSIKEKEQTDEMAQRIVDALDAKDEEALRAVFSEKALSEADDLDEGIAYIFDQYEGVCIEYKNPGGRISEHFGVPARTLVADPRLEITTDKGKYVLYFELWVIQEADPEALGVYRMRLFDYEDWEEYAGYTYGSDSDRAGVYHPAWDE